MKDLKIAVAGRKNMGGFLLRRLAAEGFNVPLSFNSSELWFNGDSRGPFRGGALTGRDMRGIGNALDRYMDGVDVMFLAIPSGEHETPLIDYCMSRGVYTILFCKDDLARNYANRRRHRHLIGANATLGGRTMSLPWLRMQHLNRKKFTVYAVWNASTNKWMDEIVNHNDSASGAFDTVGLLGLAEPGSGDYVGFLNGEIGGDYGKKICIAINDSVLREGPYITPADIRYKPFKNAADVELITLPTRNLTYMIRIDNWGMPVEFDTQSAGGLYGQFNGITIAGAFCDTSGNDAISQWIKGGRTNGVQIRFRGEHDFEGMIEMAGLGAGKATVGAAMNDLYQFIDARNGSLLEASWPERTAA